MPLRSSACFKCLARKIRCDETRPACTRCQTHGVVCPGYKTAHPNDIEFRDQTGLTTQRVECASRSRHVVRQKSGTGSSVQATRHHNSTSTAVIKDFVNFSSGKKRGSISIAPGRYGPGVQMNLPLSCLKSASVHRLQLRSTFLRLYMPQTSHSKESSLEFFHLEYLRTLVQLSSTSPAVIHGLDALSLVQIGSVYKNQELLRQAVQAYTRSLKSLARALSRPNSVQDDNVLAAATLLSLCEFFDEIKQQGQGWINHQHGIQRLIEARGPDSITSRLATLLYWNTVNSTIPIALLKRSAIVLPAKWRMLESKVLSESQYAESYRLGRALPGLLERHDKLHPCDANFSHDLNTLIDECESLEDSMHSYYRSKAHQGPTLEDIVKFPTFYAALHDDRTLTHAYKFPSLTSALKHTEYWLRMYYVHANLHSLRNMRRQQQRQQRQQQQQQSGLSSSSTDQEGTQQADTESPDLHERGKWMDNAKDAKYQAEVEELLGLIINLCRCVPFLIDAAHATLGHIACFLPLHLAAYHFHACKLWHWLRWVRLVRDCVFDRGLSMPVVSLPELPPKSAEELDE